MNNIMSCGLIVYPKIKDSDLDKLVLLALKNGPVGITVITPNKQSAVITLEVTKRPKGYSRVLVDTYSSNWDISSYGQESFSRFEKNIPDSEDRKEVFCGKRIMRMDTKITGEGMVLAFILNFLEDGKYLEEIKKIAEATGFSQK